ncbi:MAG TPA: cobalamin-dependent protein [Acidimicrobiia bacterium]
MTAPEFSEIELALTSTALAGDAGGLYRIASGLMDDGVPFDSILFDYLMATERSVGIRWAQGDYLVAEEHAVTAAIETVVSLLTGMLDQPTDAPHVVVTTAEGDDHSLPARAAAAYLLFLGFRTSFLGGNVPGDDLGEYLRADPPAVLVLSGAMTTHLLGARNVIQAAHEAGVAVVVGGKAFGQDGIWAEAVGADGWVGSLRAASGVVEEWAYGNPPAIKPMPDLPEDLTDLIAIRTAVSAEAEHWLASELDGEVPARLKDEIRLLQAAVEAALLTSDDQIVVEMLHWQRESLNAHGHDGLSVAKALQTSLEASSTAGGPVLRRAIQSLSE